MISAITSQCDEDLNTIPWELTDASILQVRASLRINVWGHVNDMWSQKIIDVLRYMGGELTDEDVTEGQYISNWALASERAATGGMSPKMTKEERDRRIIGLASDGAIPMEGEAFEQARQRMAQPRGFRIRAQELRSQLKM